MPFTPSHAVVALAFTRTPLVPAAVAVGAMAPDLPLYVPGIGPSYAQTHANPALSVVIAAVLLAAWWWVLRPAVRELVPGTVAERLPEAWDAGGPVHRRGEASGGRIVFVLLVAASLTVGVLSHIAWDAFTHEDRWGMRLVPALAEMWGPFAGYRWLQYASGVLGLGGIAVWAGIRLRRAPIGAVRHVLPPAVRIVWWFSLPAFLAGAWVVGLVVYGGLDAEWTARHLAYRVLPPACALWGAFTLALCVAVRVVRGRARR